MKTTSPPHSIANIESNLLSGIAHDMRGNFNGLIGFSDLLDSNFETLSNEQKKDYIHLLKLLAFQSFLGNLTMLTWVKLISNNLHLNYSTISSSDLFKSVILYCEANLESKHCNITVASPNPIYIQGDTHHLSIAIANFITYILNITEPQSTIQILAEQTSLQKHLITFSFKISSDANQSRIMDNIRLFSSLSVSENTLSLWVAANILKEHQIEIIVHEDELLVIHLTI